MSFDGVDKQPKKCRLVSDFLLSITFGVIVGLTFSVIELNNRIREKSNEVTKKSEEIAGKDKEIATLKQVCQNWNQMYSEVYAEYISQKQIAEWLRRN